MLLARTAVASEEIVALGVPHAVTVTFPEAIPPGPVQESEYVDVWATATLSEPADPDPDQLLDGVHVDAFVALHVSVTDPFVATSDADAVSETIGMGASCDDPPPPPHADVKASVVYAKTRQRMRELLDLDPTKLSLL